MRGSRTASGQAATEYAVMLFLFVLIALSLMFLIGAFTDYGWRIISLIAWEPYWD